MAESRRRFLTAALTIGGALIAGCQKSRFDANHPMAGSPVHTDLEPLRKRFPRLYGMVSAHWQEVAVAEDSWAAGPSDILIQAVIVLQKSDLNPILVDYYWGPPEKPWDSALSDQLRPFIPPSGEWQWDGRFEAEVIPEDFFGWVYVDLRSATVYLYIYTQ